MLDAMQEMDVNYGAYAPGSVEGKAFNKASKAGARDFAKKRR